MDENKLLGVFAFIALHGKDLNSGAIITVEPNRLRIRLATIQEK
jgi:hypothetical protein